MVCPLANLLATEQVRFGDMLLVDRDENDQALSFHREGQGAVIPAPTRRALRVPAVRIAASAASKGSENISAHELEPVLT